jgi:hypothetical protein
VAKRAVGSWMDGLSRINGGCITTTNPSNIRRNAIEERSHRIEPTDQIVNDIRLRL